MNKLKILLTSIAILFILWLASWFGLFSFLSSPNTASRETISPTQVINQKVSISIIFENERKSDFSKEIKDENETAFSLLEETTKANSLKLETQQYDFGVFVKSIDGHESSNKMAWIYFVNGESGQVAADMYKLKPGDVVEWKYIPPSEGE